MVATFTCEELLYATNGRLMTGKMDDSKGRLVWNIDEVEPGCWFIAFASGFYDAHDDIETAFARGARGCIINRRTRYSFRQGNATLITVPDTKTALFDIARYWRHIVNPRVIGVSGSKGRRASLTLLLQFLQEKFKCHIAFMNELAWRGCLRDVLQMPRDTEVLLFESGATERGEIAQLGGALEPDLAVVTTIQHHLPTAERNEHLAAMYCELLETVNEHSGGIKAVVSDENEMVKKRARTIMNGLPVISQSESASISTDFVTPQQLQTLSNLMQQTIGQPITRADLWCALNTAATLGISESELKSFFEESPTPITAAH